MSFRDTYLTDEELQQLIADVEAYELIPAPPDMANDVWEKIEISVRSEMPAAIQRSRNKEFQLYCFRVITSVAAAILLIFIVPKVSETMPKITEVVQDTESEYNPNISIRYETKEEALNDVGIFAETFGNSNLFDNDFEWNIFK